MKKQNYRTIVADLSTQMESLVKILGDENLVRWLNSQYDPTGIKADYTQWLAKQFKKIGGLPTNTKELLKEFDRLKKIGELKGKFSPDIGSYKTIEDIRKAIAPYQGFTSKKQQKKKQVEGVMMTLSNYGEITYGSHGYLLLYVDDAEKVSTFLNVLGITSWCLRHEDMAANYTPITFLIKNGKVVANLAGSEGVIYDRNDEHSENPEHYEVLMESGSDVLFESRTLYENFPDKTKMKVREYCAKDAKRAQVFAVYVLHNMFPEGEEVISKNAQSSYLYAYNALGGRFPAGEAAILADGDYVGDYAVNIMRGRWPAGEKKILERPHDAFKYARHCIKGEWIEGEPIIATDASSAVAYAIHILKGSFPKAEETIAKDSYCSYAYARDCLKHRFPEGEASMLGDTRNGYADAVSYAGNIIEARWPELEEKLSEDVVDAQQETFESRRYCRIFNLYYNEELKKFISLIHIEPDIKELREPVSSRPPEGTELEGEVGRPVDASFRPLESLIMTADLESQMPALLKIISNEETIRWLNEQYDPSGTKADYTQWLVKLFAGGAFHGYTPNIYNHLKEFDRLKKLPALKGKLNLDIGSYKTYPALIQAIKPFEGMVSKKKQKTTNVQGIMMNLNEYGEVKHLRDYTLLHVTDPWKVSDFLIKLGITSWCIKDVGYAKDYYPITFILRDGKVWANLASNGRIYDRADDTDEDPGHYSVLLHGGFDVRYINLSTFNQLEPEDAKLMKSKAAELPISAYAFATNVMDGPFPEGEDVIATDSGYSYSYASMVLHDRFPKGEPMIATSPHHAIVYAIHIIKGRFPEGEPAILTRADSILRYARQVIWGRWLEGEEALLKLGQTDELCDYAENVMHERWPAAEEIFLRVGNPWVLYWYAANVIPGRWPEAESLILRSVDVAFSYAKSKNLRLVSGGDEHGPIYSFEEIGESK